MIRHMDKHTLMDVIGDHNDSLRGLVDPVLRLAIKHGFYNELMWGIGKEGLFNVSIVCSDIFYWGVADAEPLTSQMLPALKQAIEDCRTAEGAEPFSEVWGPTLFCARQRGARPQGAAYSMFEEALWPLFDAVGPAREISIGNPYHPGEYKPGKMVREDAK